MPDRSSTPRAIAAATHAAARAADHAAIDRLTEELLPALIAKLGATGLGELEVRQGGWRIRLRRPATASAGARESARGSTGDRILGLSEGADDYLAEALLARRARRSRADDPAAHRAAARRRARRRTSSSCRGDLVVDAGRHEARIAGRPVILSALELRLLATLLDADGRALTRDQLLDGIHGTGEGDVLDRAIDVYIKRLREKLGDDAERAALRRDGPRRRLSGRRPRRAAPAGRRRAA